MHERWRGGQIGLPQILRRDFAEAIGQSNPLERRYLPNWADIELHEKMQLQSVAAIR